MKTEILAAIGFVLAASLQTAFAQYPNKPVRIVVPVTTGGPSDLVARILGDKLSGSLGQPMIIENRPGASQTVGMAFVAKSDPDGYTLLQAAANMAINPILMTDLPFDTVKAFAPVSLTHMTPYVFVVSSQLPVNSLPELFKYIRDNKGKITYGTTGQGSPQQLATLLLAQLGRASGPDLQPHHLHDRSAGCLGPAHQVRFAARARGDHAAAQPLFPERADGHRRRCARL